MIEPVIAMQWVEATLRASSSVAAAAEWATGSAGRIFEGLGPDDTPYPFITLTVQASSVVRGLGTARIMGSTMIAVKIVTEAPSYDPMKELAKAIDQALTLGEGVSVTDGLIFTSTQEESIAYTESDGGHTYRYLGGVYAVQAQSN